jgi:hypothetical protein
MHTGVEGEGGMTYQKSLQKLVYKTAIKHKNKETPINFFKDHEPTPKIFGKNIGFPCSLDIQPVCT